MQPIFYKDTNYKSFFCRFFEIYKLFYLYMCKNYINFVPTILYLW